MTTTPLVIGVDPGTSAGLAFYLTRTDSFDALLYRNDFIGLCRRIDGLLADYPGAVVAVERFTLGGRRVLTSQTAALEVIGACRYLAAVRGSRSFLVQGASDAQRMGGSDVLRQLGWYRACRGDHLAKAAAQVVLALGVTHPQTLVELTERARITG